jgi:hypothetical protein
MKNLINAITAQHRQRLEDFIFQINQIQDVKELDTWYYNELVPRGKITLGMSLDVLRAYLIKRKEKEINKSIERDVNKIKTVMSSGELTEVKISVEWKRSNTWGSNPKGEAWVSFIDKDGNRNSHYITTESIGGCGYDKLSTAVAQCLNQFNEVLKVLYTEKDKHIDQKNHDLLGYGSGYGILPNVEGGVGVSCYPRMFEKVGFKFNQIASGKTYDVFMITKAIK